jgi:hypothetical protein
MKNGGQSSKSGKPGWLVAGAVAITLALASCGPSMWKSPNGVDTSACLSCAAMMCPSEAAACDASAGCKTLRSCTLACKAGDSGCQNDCTKKAASDSTAIVAGANYLECATSSCSDACTPPPPGGSGGAQGGSGSGGTSGDGAFHVAAGGYVTVGDWKGYAFTATDGISASSIFPDNFSSLGAGGTLCASGTVAGTADYSAVAILGVNINQPQGNPAPAPSTWTPKGLGIAWQVSNIQTRTELRIQLQAHGGDVNENYRWCWSQADNTGGISWSQFNTHCWDNSGTAYDGTTPLESVMVLVPGSTGPVSFDFCLKQIGQLQ